MKVRPGANVTVRRTADTKSAEVRKLQPGDVCVQEGPMMRQEPGIVRMPVRDGFVTVHARFVGGPTFLEMADGSLPVEAEDIAGGRAIMNGKASSSSSKDSAPTWSQTLTSNRVTGGDM